MLLCFSAQTINKRRATGMRAIKPRLSVKNPGVNRRAPQTSNTSPSSISMAGISPFCKLVWTLLSVAIP